MLMKTLDYKLLLALALFASVLAAGMLAEHSLQLALKMHVPIRRLPVSYTHLDVYKRQVWTAPRSPHRRTEVDRG